MIYILAAGATVLGAILGSFINALSFRWGSGSIWRGRSRCMHCGHTLAARDLVPIVSYLETGGRCRYCGSRISAQYPLVEAGGALLALAVYNLHPEPTAFFFWLAVWMTILFVVVYDLRHTVIPWSCSIVLGLLGLIHVWSMGLGVWQLAAGPLLAVPLFSIWALSRGRAMGLGDSALMLGLGWLLGPTAGLTALMLGIWVGAGVGILRMLAHGGVTMRSEVPLAPFLAIGAYMAHFLHADFFQATIYLFL